MTDEAPVPELERRLGRLEREIQFLRIGTLFLVLLVFALAIATVRWGMAHERSRRVFDTVTARQFFLGVPGNAVGAWKSKGADGAANLEMRGLHGSWVGLSGNGQIGVADSESGFHLLPRTMFLGSNDGAPCFVLERGPDGAAYIYDGKGGAVRLSGPLPHPLVLDSFRKVDPHAATR